MLALSRPPAKGRVVVLRHQSCPICTPQNEPLELVSLLCAVPLQPLFVFQGSLQSYYHMVITLRLMTLN